MVKINLRKNLNKFLGIFKKRHVLFIAIVGVVAVLELCLFLFYGGGIAKISSLSRITNSTATGIILFEGDKCAQCDKVETYIKNNKVESKVTFTRLEVFGNEANANLLEDKAQTCGLNPDQIGVPFLWDGAHCIVGYVDVISFFRNKITAKKP